MKYDPAPRIPGLGEGFFDPVRPAVFPRATLRFRNDRAAKEVGLEGVPPEEWEAHFARFEPLPGNLEKPLALRYHGHQFDVYNPSLGDGRGFLFAQLRDSRGRLLDLATKGSGRTPWSRGGDGKLTLKGGVREVLATEMLDALGVPTSRSFSLFETGEALYRGDEPSPTRSSVLVRLSHSHVRFGSFQRLAYDGDEERLDKLLAYAIEHFYPDVGAGRDRAKQFLSRVNRASAALCARWMLAGFVHGVLNSDNMVVTGESFDYGPYRFLPHYDVGFTAAYFDHSGLYAYGRQPVAVLRNVLRLAEALARLGDAIDAIDPAALVGEYEGAIVAETERSLARRLGVRSERDLDAPLVAAAFAFLDESKVPFEAFFFDLYGGPSGLAARTEGSRREHYEGNAWRAFLDIFERYESAVSRRPAALETLLIGEIESIWKAIDERDDWSYFEAKVAAIRAYGHALAP